MPEPLLKASSLERTFGSGPESVRAVRGVDVELSPGDRLLVMGPSGSGKTTLLSMLGGLLTPSSGDVQLDGTELYRQDDRERARLRLRKIGFIFQSFNLLSSLTARENVEVPLRLAGIGHADSRNKADTVLQRLGLGDRRDHRPKDLSGGEKQRVAIARALANDAQLILADEPTANLDSENGQIVAEDLERLAEEEERAIIIVSHDDRLRRIASRVVRIEDGRLSENAKSGD